MNPKNPTEFEQIAAEHAAGNVLTEMFGFLRHTKKWWLLPILLVLVVFGTLLLLSSTAAAPFIYTLF